jgi:DNA-binding NarL/FixJ family response regulator
MVAAGSAALAEGRWADARAAFEAVLAQAESPVARDGLGAALWWLGEPQAVLAHRERAYVGFRRAGDEPAAAMTAIAVCISYAVEFGNGAAASGWLARAESVVDVDDPGPVRGWLWLMAGFFADGCDAACALFERARQRARATGDVDLELTALSDRGGRLVAAGRVAEGLAALDEALAGALGGEFRRLETVVWACCTMLGACEQAGDLTRAGEWMRVIDEFTDRYCCPFMYATCRTHYGSLLVARGRWDEAERELAAAIRMSGRGGPVPHAHALARLADLRLRQGRVEEAESLLDSCADDVVGARARLARGEPEVAVALLRRCLDRTSGAAAADVLGLLVEAQLAAGDPAAAAAGVQRLSDMAAAASRASRPPGLADSYLAARAAAAAGHVAAAEGDAERAAERLRSALAALTRLDLPVDAAQVRLALARVCADDAGAVAVAEATAALETFDRVGAALLADAAAALLRSLGAPGRSGPRGASGLTHREEQVLRLVGLGLSNPEIARRLHISRKTAAHHVSNVLAKLGLRNRAEVAAFAARTPNARPPSGARPPPVAGPSEGANRAFART